MKVLFFLTLLSFSFAARNEKALEIHIFNIGQADCQLVVFPSGYSILIDMGDNDTKNASHTKYVAKRIEEILGHKNIDIFVLSHFHTANSGVIGKNGIWYLLETAGFTIKKFIKRNVGSYKGKYADCKKSSMTWKYAGEMDDKMAAVVCYAVSSEEKTKLSRVAVNAERCTNKQIHPPDEGAKVTVLIRDALGVDSTDTAKPIARNSIDDEVKVSENDYSICLKIEYGKFVYATCGDLSGYTVDQTIKPHDIESQVAPMYGEVDLMKVNYHGSKTATNEDWVSYLKPTVSVVTCGENKELPDQDPLKRLKNAKSDIYTTGKDCNQENIEAVGDITQIGGEIIVTVEKGRSTFTVGNLAGDFRKTYKIKQNKPEHRTCELLEA